MTQLPTTLTAVTVYPDRARLVRRGAVSLPAGLHALEITGLPPKLNPDSLRAAARGTAPARLRGVQAQRAFFSETPSEVVRQMEAQIEALQDELSSLKAQADLLKQNRTAVNALFGQAETYATALAAGEMTVAAQLAIFDGLRAQAASLDAEYLRTAQEQRGLERRLTKLSNEYEEQRSARPRERYTAIVEVEILPVPEALAVELSIEVSYVASGASWQPLYDFRLLEDADQPALEVNYLAQVTQQTGEPWDEVSLTLSTARPALAGRLPELDPWYLQPYPLPSTGPQARRAEAGAVLRAVQSPVAAPVAPRAVEAEPITAEVEQAGAAVAYRVPGPVSLPADGAPHKVTLTRYRLDPVLDYVSAPRLVGAAYRRARLTNDSLYVLLPGSANLFAGDEFIGTTSLGLTAPQGEIELYLGVDDRIKVERELVRREVDKKLIGGRERLRFGYTITLENLLPVEAHLTLHDQIPVARHADVKVKLESAEPQPAEQTELNLLNWDLVLKSQEKRGVRFDFSIDYPQGMALTGLP